MISKSSATYKQIRQNLDPLINGTVLSIDPSMGSQSSLPGWAVMHAGKEVDRGVFPVPREGDHSIRLSAVREYMMLLIDERVPDIIVVENIPVTAQGFRSQVSHASLIMARGVILSCIGELPWVQIMPVSWKKLVRPSYVKGDAEDAQEIAWVVYQEALRIAKENPPKGYKAS